MNDTASITSPANSRQAVGNRTISRVEQPTSLNAMWTAYRRSSYKSIENCHICRTDLHVVALVLVYRSEKRRAESGEGVGAAVTTTFGYDYTGNRVYQVSNNATTTYPSKYYSVVSTMSGAITTATSTDYIWTGDTLVAYIEQALINGTATGTPSTYYVHPDHLGSTNVVTNASGTVVTAKDYYPYGAVRVNSGSASLGRGYINQFSDASNLDYLQARYYDSQRSQFLSEDPMFLGDPRAQNLANPQSLNSYSYANDNPITNKDPDGKTPQEAALGTAVGILQGLVRQLQSAVSALQNPGAAAQGFVQNTLSNARQSVSLVHDLINNPSRTYSEVSSGVKISTDQFMNLSDYTRGVAIGNFTSDAMVFAATYKAANGLVGDTAQSTSAVYGSTPEGRAFTFHYGVERGPFRNIPGSVVDETVNNYTSKVDLGGGKTGYYSATNNVTVITGDGGNIVSVRKGPISNGQ